MSTIEDKLNEIIQFFVKLTKLVFVLAIPPILVKILKKGDDQLTPPLTFLGITSFVGTKLWLKVLIGLFAFTNACSGHRGVVRPTQTSSEEFNFFTNLEIPSIQEILTIAIPFAILVYLLSQAFEKIFTFLKMQYELDTRKILIYHACLLILVLPFIFKFDPDVEYILLVLFLCSLYLILVLTLVNLNKSGLIIFHVKQTLLSYSYTILVSIGVYFITVLYFGLNSDKLNLDKYESEDLFEALLLNQKTEGKDRTLANVLLKSNSRDDASYLLRDDKEHWILNSDSIKVGKIDSILQNARIRPGYTSKFYFKCSIPDNQELSKNYLILNTINLKTLYKKEVVVYLDKIYENYDDY